MKTLAFAEETFVKGIRNRLRTSFETCEVYGMKDGCNLVHYSGKQAADVYVLYVCVLM